jgi:hypothetical protein
MASTDSGVSGFDSVGWIKWYFHSRFTLTQFSKRFQYSIQEETMRAYSHHLHYHLHSMMSPQFWIHLYAYNDIARFIPDLRLFLLSLPVP